MSRPIPNPDFPLDYAALVPLEARLRAGPVALERPVIVLGGWRSPKCSATWTRNVLRPFTSGREDDFLCVSYPWSPTIESAAAKALRAVRERFPDQSEFDVVGVSMGGIVARVLAHALVGDDRPPLRVRRIFTLASPHRGARFADWVTPGRAARDLRRGSGLLRRLDALRARGEYELHCYALLRDWLVGATRSAPPGTEPMWLDAETITAKLISHYTVNRDRRLLADVALRLRGEAPIASPGSPPPRD
jgi:pimeloyl-ACP methyl ester carboxylesterase